MPVTIVNGSQFGDEGKGKIVDLMASSFDLGVRPTAGDNAGHTIVANGQTIKMRLTSSAIVAGTPVIIGDDVMINPVILAENT
jgi:adenylosuccinate synthase